jgi:hypothetical protein
VPIIPLTDLAHGENASEIRRVRGVHRKWLEEAFEQERQAPSFQRKMKVLDDDERCVLPSPEKAVSHYYQAWRRDGTWQAIHDVLRIQLRGANGRHTQPSAGILGGNGSGSDDTPDAGSFGPSDEKATAFADASRRGLRNLGRCITSHCSCLYLCCQVYIQRRKRSWGDTPP